MNSIEFIWIHTQVVGTCINLLFNGNALWLLQIRECRLDQLRKMTRQMSMAYTLEMVVVGIVVKMAIDRKRFIQDIAWISSCNKIGRGHIWRHHLHDVGWPCLPSGWDPWWDSRRTCEAGRYSSGVHDDDEMSVNRYSPAESTRDDGNSDSTQIKELLNDPTIGSNWWK